MPRIIKDVDSISRRLQAKWGFSKFHANNYAWSIAQGSSKEYRKPLNIIKRMRRAQVMKHYKDMGGRYIYPDFLVSEIGREAVKREDDQLREWGWKRDDTTSYFAVYYYGYYHGSPTKTKEEWERFTEYRKAMGEQLKREGYIFHVPV